jgi:hypothetical protein
MAFAKPTEMGDAEFHGRVAAIRNWFNVLNPYLSAGDLFKLEDANFALAGGKPSKDLAPLHLWAISAKRYALFNIGPDGKPIIRKASAHGLGHLMAPPYADADAPTSIPAPASPLKDIGVDRWQHDVWYRIVDAALNGNSDRPNLADLPGFDQPAASRYAATTPALLRWFDRHNHGRDETARVRPFNFLTVFPARRRVAPDLTGPVGLPDIYAARRRSSDELLHPVAPYNPNPALAAANCFDRLTGEPVPIDRLKTYADALSDYHLHPEAKFLNGDYLDHGPTARRHLYVAGVRYIGKEANRWEEQFYLGLDPKAQIEYDGGPDAIEQVRCRVREAAKVFGQRQLAKAAGVSRETLRAIVCGNAIPRARVVKQLLDAISALSAGPNCL